MYFIEPCTVCGKLTEIHFSKLLDENAKIYCSAPCRKKDLLKRKAGKEKLEDL